MSASRAVTRNSTKRMTRVFNFLHRGPLPIDGLCDIVLAFCPKLDGTCRLAIPSLALWRSKALAVLPNAVVATANRGLIELFDTSNGFLRASIYNPSFVVALANLPPGQLAVGSSDDKVRVWDTESAACLLTLAGHTGSVRAIVVLPNGQLASGSFDCTVRVWDVENATCLLTLVGHVESVYALAVLPDGRLASGSWDMTVRVWDTCNGECLSTILVGLPITVLCALPDGRLATFTFDTVIRLWDVSTGTCLLTLAGHYANVSTMAVMSNGDLASAANNSVRLWNTANGRCSGECYYQIEMSGCVKALVGLAGGKLVVVDDKKISAFE
jgi:WD40 repeat protein